MNKSNLLYKASLLGAIVLGAETSDMHQGMYQKEDGYGVGNINGMHHQDALGWDNTTVGIASNVFDNLLSQNGIRTNDPNYIGALEPIRAGKFIVKWLKVPPFFNDTAVKYLKFFLENCVKQVDGIQANQVQESGTLTFGANGQEYSFPGQLKEGNKSVSLTTITCTGDGLGKLMRYWMYGMTDPITNVHHMYGKNLRFIRPNYSGTLLYVFLGPTARPGDIEYACLWNECWPTSGDGKDKFNSQEIGSDQAVGDQTVEFSGIFQDGPEVNILAKYIVAGTGLAGQSYFEQMLPAYMYDKYINTLSSDTSKEAMPGLSVRQRDNIENATGTYSKDIKASRDAQLEKYGINDAVLPSSQTATYLDGDDKNDLSDLAFKSTSFVDGSSQE